LAPQSGFVAPQAVKQGGVKVGKLQEALGWGASGEWIASDWPVCPIAEKRTLERAVGPNIF
jgi:hypothetical protein